MGSFLEKPVTEKETSEQSGELKDGGSLQYGVSAMQGWRVNMEDAHVHRIGLGDRGDLGLFGVFDGHGGRLVACHAAENLEAEICGNEHFSKLPAAGTSSAGKEAAATLGKAVCAAFLSLDKKMRELDQIKGGVDHSGSTAVVSFITPSHYVVGNCGDSRLVICGEDKVLFSSLDHKPTQPSEQARIENAGGTVSFRRVNGDLAVSRALGDFLYKANDSLPDVEQQVSAEPDVSVIARKPTDQFVLLACDGIWDVMSNEAVCSFVLTKMREGLPLSLICEDLIDHCLDLGSRDNMSVIIVALPGAPSELGSKSIDDVRKAREASEDTSMAQVAGA
ncbi:Protein phosphatase 1B [Hondaea fermentalgiana]|uniref:Protein phosphatase 1B n=1 Tax=Hondaea fermentalgiana TaxID=2315210 RepID=A0A2R5G3E9_9STRA|nr:Protein phosphatase 1B [Hondaea fermentalgiana]|eukprot:GBG25566.1 Protein phosphatase 1B [Hondaea fermentalgiana]